MIQYQHQTQALDELEAQIFKLEKERTEIKHSIQSLEKVIEMHEVPITADDIPNLRKNTKQTSLSYGLVTKFIYQYLGLLDVGSDATVSEIFNYCVEVSNWDNFTPESIRMFRRAVRKRLQNMAYQGQIRRTRKGTHHAEAKYKLLT